MIGLSLSFCVRDILQGKVDLGVVEKIITGTKIESGRDLEEVLSQYMETYWNNDPRAIDIVNWLLRTERIEQPRVKGQQAPNISQGHWRNT